MADASAHHKQVENLMRAKVFVESVKYRQLERVDDTANRVDNPPSQQPAKCRVGQCAPQRAKDKQTQPAHRNINHRRKPFRTGDPQSLYQHAGDGDTPHKRQQRTAHPAAKDNQADRRVRPCDQHKNHHVVNLSKDL